jgi:hypothetical protein
MVETVSEYLSEKLSEYRILIGPLERAAAELNYAQNLTKAKLESEISDHVPVLGALADILDISIMDLLLAQDRSEFIQAAMAQSGLSTEDVMHQLRSLAPPSREDLHALGLEK